IMWSSRNYHKYIIESEWIDDIIFLPFEDLLLPAPKGYDALLSREYGDFMQPVQSPSFHGEVIFDVERSYADVLKELRKKASFKNKLSHLLPI
ncbi:MAG: LicD family protein, partial [Muribaculaceae bacterium]|nr:LicD family protein [Muribaculaceae bacterium]